MTPEEREKTAQEEKRIQEKAEEIRKWAEGEEKNTPKNISEIRKGLDKAYKSNENTTGKDLEGRIDEMTMETNEAIETIRLQEYQKAKTRLEEFRKKHKQSKSPEELTREDADLKKQFGVE